MAICYKDYLSIALDQLFKEKFQNGFWDNEKGIIIEKLKYSTTWKWNYEISRNTRYGLFTLSNILLAKKHFGLVTNSYDEKIERYLHWIYSEQDIYSISDLTYGGILNMVLGKILNYSIDFDLNKIIDKFNKSFREALLLDDNQHSLLLIAGRYLYEVSQDKSILDKIRILTTILISSQSKNGSFDTYDIRSCYHQRKMYVIWGLCFAGEVLSLEKENVIRAIEKSLENTWKYNRDFNDNALIWHPPIYLNKTRYGIKIPVISYKSSEYLFECHQTFYANAINFYQLIFNRKDFSSERRKTLEWIFGGNRINRNLVDLTKINLPVRILDKKGRLFIKGQQFKGSYEVGSYILALSGLLKFDKTI